MTTRLTGTEWPSPSVSTSVSTTEILKFESPLDVSSVIGRSRTMAVLSPPAMRPWFFEPERKGLETVMTW